MSMNICITASRKVTFKKANGKRSGEIQHISFEAFQTPTSVTYAIIGSKDPKVAYLDWVLKECSHDEEQPVNTHNIWRDGSVMSNEIYNAGKEHATQFVQWCEDAEKQGYTIKFEDV